MANKRNLKKAIDCVAAELLLECTFIRQTKKDADAEELGKIFARILKTHSDMRSRVSFPEPGMTAKAYYKALNASLVKEAREIVEAMEALG